MDIQKEREAFQKEMLDLKYVTGNISAFWDEKTQNYDIAITELRMAWHAWQAAKAQAVPEGFVLIKASDRDQEMLELIDQRDHMEDQAEQLKDKLQGLYGVDFGEHSNCNFPFQNAIDFDDSDFVLVLKEPNEEMIISGLAVVATGIGKHNIDEEIRKIWQKMIETQEKANEL